MNLANHVSPSPAQVNLGIEFLIREPADTYHAKSREFLSSHALADFRRCPLLYRKKQLGQIEDEDRPAYLVGRALHTLVLEGREVFEREYAVGGPVNPKTGELFGAATKAFAEWAAAQGKPVLTLAQFDVIENMAEGVRQNGIARDLLSEGVAEGVVRADYCQMPAQIRMDFFSPYLGIMDLKSADSLDYFEADAWRYHYPHQVAFYRAVLAEVIGIHQPVHFIVVEKKQPFRCGVWKLDETTLNIARQENEAAIERLKRCLATDTWPSGYETLRVFEGR